MNDREGDENVKTDLKKAFENFINGDKNSFEEIYNEIKQPVFVIIFRIVLQKELAEDIMQELFMKIFVSPPDKSVSNLRAYIFQMARNLSIDALRSNGGIRWEDVNDFDGSNDGGLERFILGLDVEKAMVKLQRLEREIISLHINGELTFLEISKIVGLSLPSVYRKYCKGIKTLRKELNGE